MHPAQVALDEVTLWTSAWLYGVHRKWAETAVFHVAPAMQHPDSTVSTPLWWILEKMHINRLKSLIQNHMWHEHSECRRAENSTVQKWSVIIIMCACAPPYTHTHTHTPVPPPPPTHTHTQMHACMHSHKLALFVLFVVGNKNTGNCFCV